MRQRFLLFKEFIIFRSVQIFLFISTVIGVFGVLQLIWPQFNDWVTRLAMSIQAQQVLSFIQSNWFSITLFFLLFASFEGFYQHTMRMQSDLKSLREKWEGDEVQIDLDIKPEYDHKYLHGRVDIEIYNPAYKDITDLRVELVNLTSSIPGHQGLPNIVNSSYRFFTSGTGFTKPNTIGALRSARIGIAENQNHNFTFLLDRPWSPNTRYVTDNQQGDKICVEDYELEILVRANIDSRPIRPVQFKGHIVFDKREMYATFTQEGGWSKSDTPQIDSYIREWSGGIV